MILSVSRRPRWPRQVLFHVAVADSFAHKLCQCKHSTSSIDIYGLNDYTSMLSAREPPKSARQQRVHPRRPLPQHALPHLAGGQVQEGRGGSDTSHRNEDGTIRYGSKRITALAKQMVSQGYHKSV
jgi:hypothetical protein